jgi:nickel/cobalt exporter
MPLLGGIRRLTRDDAGNDRAIIQTSVTNAMIPLFGATGSVYATAVSVGLLHGLEPGHGWPVAAIYALDHSRRWTHGILAGLIIGGAHLVSSFAVVAGFVLLNRWLGVTGLPYAMQAAGLVLIGMGIYQWFRPAHSHAHLDTGRNHHRDHQHDDTVRDSTQEHNAGLWAITVFAFALGFAHEEEFAIIALCAGRLSCWAVMAIYALAVAGSILALTLLSIATLNRFETRIQRWIPYLPRLSALILALMGTAFVLELI